MDEKILTLLKSNNMDDILIGLTLLGNTDYRGFVAKYGREEFDDSRCSLSRKPFGNNLESFYYKITENFYILVSNAYIFCECHSNYNIQNEVITHS